MESTRTRLVEAAKTASGAAGKASPFDKYKLAIVTRDIVGSGGQTFTKGQLTIADPDTYMLKGDDHRAVYSVPHNGHIMLPDKDVKFC